MNPTFRVMAFYALAYFVRLFYLEEVAEIRVADASVYSSRRLHEEIDTQLVIEFRFTEFRRGFSACSENIIHIWPFPFWAGGHLS